MVFAMNSTVISGTPRTNSMKITESKRTIGSRERRPSASSDAERQREHDADGRDEERDEDAAPERGRDVLDARASSRRRAG